MSTVIHFIDVGQGNMVLVQCADGTNFGNSSDLGGSEQLTAGGERI